MIRALYYHALFYSSYIQHNFLDLIISNYISNCCNILALKMQNLPLKICDLTIIMKPVSSFIRIDIMLISNFISPSKYYRKVA